MIFFRISPGGKQRRGQIMSGEGVSNHSPHRESADQDNAVSGERKGWGKNVSARIAFLFLLIADTFRYTGASRRFHDLSAIFFEYNYLSRLRCTIEESTAIKKGTTARTGTVFERLTLIGIVLFMRERKSVIS